jgi:ubiquinone/menaquinone biosynthesis C-methylase UbiE
VEAFVMQKRRSQIMREYWHRNATLVYAETLADLIQPGMTLLHAGCGWDKHDISRRYIYTCHVIGIDLDPRVQPMFHSEFHLASITEMPFADATFDVIFSEYVFEHLEDPGAAFTEMQRVLKPGGRLVILTPNLYSYKGLAAWLTPQVFHILMGRIRYGRGHEDDMYPTCYRCNTLGQFQKFAKQSGMDVVNVQYITNGPTWFQEFPVLFELFHLYHLLIWRFEAARFLRCAMVVELQKPAPSVMRNGTCCSLTSR